MRASELIQQLQTLTQRYGDLEVVMDDDTSPVVEFNDDVEGDGGVFLVA